MIVYDGDACKDSLVEVVSSGTGHLILRIKGQLVPSTFIVPHVHLQVQIVRPEWFWRVREEESATTIPNDDRTCLFTFMIMYNPRKQSSGQTN
jgi:adenine deaminase